MTILEPIAFGAMDSQLLEGHARKSTLAAATTQIGDGYPVNQKGPNTWTGQPSTQTNPMHCQVSRGVPTAPCNPMLFANMSAHYFVFQGIPWIFLGLLGVFVVPLGWCTQFFHTWPSLASVCELLDGRSHSLWCKTLVDAYDCCSRDVVAGDASCMAFAGTRICRASVGRLDKNAGKS